MAKGIFSQQAVTLIELLVVIAIIGILAAIGIPMFEEYREKGFDARSVSTIRNAATGEEVYYTDNQSYVDCIGAVACQNTLPGFTNSEGVNIDMFQVPAAGGVPEYFTGRAYHPRGSRDSVGTAYMWNSNQGGLQ